MPYFVVSGVFFGSGVSGVFPAGCGRSVGGSVAAFAVMAEGGWGVAAGGAWVDDVAALGPAEVSAVADVVEEHPASTPAPSAVDTRTVAGQRRSSDERVIGGR